MMKNYMLSIGLAWGDEAKTGFGTVVLLHSIRSVNVQHNTCIIVLIQLWVQALIQFGTAWGLISTGWYRLWGPPLTVI